MAQKAAKSTARRNAQILNQTHLTTLAVHAAFFLLRLLVFGRPLTRTALLLYVLLCAPSLVIEFGVFEMNSRPKYTAVAGAGPAEQLRRAGEDLEAKGLTEWMWDVLYWTWGCLSVVAVLGDFGWWLYIAVPLYSAWLAWSTYGNVRKGLGMGGAAAEDASANSGATSRRQQKMDKRGGQKIQYR